MIIEGRADRTRWGSQEWTGSRNTWVEGWGGFCPVVDLLRLMMMMISSSSIFHCCDNLVFLVNRDKCPILNVWRSCIFPFSSLEAAVSLGGGGNLGVRCGGVVVGSARVLTVPGRMPLSLARPLMPRSGGQASHLEAIWLGGGPCTPSLVVQCRV